MDDKGYIQSTIDDKTVCMHRYILLISHQLDKL